MLVLAYCKAFSSSEVAGLVSFGISSLSFGVGGHLSFRLNTLMFTDTLMLYSVC